MPKYSRGHEREECTKMWRGFWHSTFGILFCWVPILGLFLSISGFWRQVVRMTVKYRKRLVLFIIYGLLSLAIGIGALVGELYLYSRNPNILNDSATWVWTKITGQAALPGQTPTTDYSGESNPGLGVFTSGDEDVEGDGVPDDAVPGVRVGSGIEADDEEGFDEDEYDEDDEEYDEDDEEYDEDDEEYDEDEDLPELDFAYEVLDLEEIEESTDEISAIYKVSTDKEELTDEDLQDLFIDVTYGDGYYLHYVHVYKPNSDFSEEYDVAAVEEQEEGETPIITRVSPQ